jgi:hypothetical protein
VKKRKQRPHELQCPKIEAEIEHSTRESKFQQCREHTSKNKGSLRIFHQNIHSFRNKRTNLEVLLNNNLPAIDVLGFTDWLLEEEISCYILPNYSLISKYCRNGRKNGGSCIYVKTNIIAKPMTNFEYLNVGEHFEASIVKLVNFKIVIICIYRNPNSDIQILLDNLEIILEYLDNKNDQVIIIRDLNINFLKDNSDKKKLEMLLNMFGLQAVINIPPRIYNETKSAIDRIILNTELWDFKTEVLETTLSDHCGQTLQFDHDLFQRKNFKQTKTVYKYIRVTNEESIKYLNYLLSAEEWDNVYHQHNTDTAQEEFIQTFSYYFDTAVPIRKVNINKQRKNQWITPGICKSSKKLKFLSRCTK